MTVEAKRNPISRPSSDRHEPSISVRDEVWIATALLHREHPEREDFTTSEIEERVRSEDVFGRYRPGVTVHINHHCVANRAPNPGKYRVLFETGKRRRRLFRPGDHFHPGRSGGASVPDRGAIPARYHALLEWYRTEFVGASAREPSADPILGLRRLGSEIWAGEDPDAYVERLRTGWG